MKKSLNAPVFAAIIATFASTSSLALAQGGTPPNDDAKTQPPANPSESSATVTIGTDGAKVDGATPSEKDKPEDMPVQKEEEGQENPWAGSTFLFDQNATTHELGLDKMQSTLPNYGWWLVLTPKYRFNKHVSMDVRINATHDFGNAEESTYKHETLLQDTWVNIGYSDKLTAISKRTSYRLGLRLVVPTSKASWGSSYYGSVSPGASLTQKIPLRGEGKLLSGMDVSVGLAFSKAFNKGTTPENGNVLALDRLGADGRPSSILDAKMNASWGLTPSLISTLEISDKFSFEAMALLLYKRLYEPTDASAPLANGDVYATVSHSPNDTRNNYATWVLAELDYALMDEIGLGVGYYNKANIYASDGTRRGIFAGGDRSIWWSHDATVYFDVNFNLDKIYDWATHTRRPKHSEEAKAGAGIGTY